MLQPKLIVCVDEATSNIDPKTNLKLNEKLFEFARGKTLIAVTHRLEHIKEYDRILMMHDGEIVENGSFSELSSIKGGHFSDLFSQYQSQRRAQY